jgi:hypothetical protein
MPTVGSSLRILPIEMVDGSLDIGIGDTGDWRVNLDTGP